MILTESTFIEANTRLESKNDPLVDHTLINIGTQAVFTGIIQILEHLAHHKFTIVAGCEQNRVIDIEHMVYPRYVTEGLHLVEIEIGPPKTCDTDIMIVNLRIDNILATGHVFEEIVGSTDSAPIADRPPRLFGIVPDIGTIVVVRRLGRHEIAIRIAQPDRTLGREIVLQHTVGKQEQILLSCKKCLGTDFIDRRDRKEVFAGNGRKSHGRSKE